jgi:ribonuclease P protein component
MRFRPEQHLRRQIDIRAVREQGQRVDCRAFTIWWRSRDLLPAQGVVSAPSRARLCVAASTAAVGPAVQRNRAKRRLREIFRRHQERLPAACDLLVVARAAVNRRPFAELERTFVEACARISAGAPAR